MAYFGASSSKQHQLSYMTDGGHGHGHGHGHGLLAMGADGLLLLGFVLIYSLRFIGMTGLPIVQPASSIGNGD